MRTHIKHLRRVVRRRLRRAVRVGWVWGWSARRGLVATVEVTYRRIAVEAFFQLL